MMKKNSFGAAAVIIGAAICATFVATDVKADSLAPGYKPCTNPSVKEYTVVEFSDGPMTVGMCTDMQESLVSYPLWNEQRPELLARYRAEIMGAEAQASVTYMYGFNANDESCKALSVEARALVDRAAGAYFIITEFSRARPKSWFVARITKGMDLVNQANAISQRCPGYAINGPSALRSTAIYGERQRLSSLKVRRPVADLVYPAKKP